MIPKRGNVPDGLPKLSRFIPKVFAFLLVSSFVYILLGLTIFQNFPISRWSKSKDHKGNAWHFSFLRSAFQEEEPTAENETLACQMMYVNPYKPSVLKLSGLGNKPVECSGYMPDLTYVKDSRLFVNKSKVKEVKNFAFCKYRDIFRHPDSDHDVTFGNWSSNFSSVLDIPDSTEFIIVVCENKKSEIVSKTYHALVPTRDKITELDLLKQKRRKVESLPMETLNVIMVGMDGTSRYQLMRGMNKTYTFLMDEGSFDMSMYTQVGINTFPNFVPLFSGYIEDEVDLWWHRSKHLDPLDTIWKDYSNAGYRTLFTEDYPSIGGFHFAKKGFLFSPTMYYSHPICVAMEKDRDIWRSGRHCVGNQAEVDFHFGYIMRFLDTFKSYPVFASTFFTKLTHDDMTNNKRVDLHTYRFYKSLKEKGHLNNTLLVSFSDHGPRWGPIRSSLHGIIESRAPYAVLTFPRWFLNKYPDIATNLRTNIRRLTSHFDTHATLRDLLYFKAKGEIPLVPRNHGLSLFREIPMNRTCPHVPIPLEFCLCNQETVEEFPSNSSISDGLAYVVVSAVTGKRNKTICAELKTKTILQNVVIRLPSLGSHDRRLFKVKIQTTPGNAVYEGTVQTKLCKDEELVQYFNQLRVGKKGNPLEVTVGDSIDRLTLYKGQADCEPDAVKKPYCYCKDLLVENSTDKTEKV